MGNRHRITYEIRVIRPSPTDDKTSGYWGLDFVCRPLESTTDASNDVPFTIEGIQGIETEYRYFVVIAKSDEFDCMQRVMVGNRLAGINGKDCDEMECKEMMKELNQAMTVAYVGKPLRLEFHRHDYDGAYAKIVPFATSDKIVALQKDKQAKGMEEQKAATTEGKIQKASTTLDIDLSQEKHLMDMLGDYLEGLPMKLVQEGWQAYQYNGSTWYYNPTEQDIYAEHPVRREASVYVQAMSFRARHAANVMQKAVQRKLYYNRLREEWAEYVLPTCMDNVVEYIFNDALEKFVLEKIHEDLLRKASEVEAELSEEQKDYMHRRESFQLATPPLVEEKELKLPEKPMKPPIEKPPEEVQEKKQATETRPEEKEELKAVEKPIDSSKVHAIEQIQKTIEKMPATLPPPLVQPPQSKVAEIIETDYAASYAPSRTANYWKTAPSIKDASVYLNHKSVSIPLGQAPAFTATPEAKKTRTTEKTLAAPLVTGGSKKHKVTCSKKAIDKIVNQAARRIQTVYRGYRVRRNRNSSVSKELIRPATWADVVVLQKKLSKTSSDLVKCRKEVKKVQKTLDEVRSESSSHLQTLYSTELLKKDAELLKLRNELESFRIRERIRMEHNGYTTSIPIVTGSPKRAKQQQPLSSLDIVEKQLECDIQSLKTLQLNNNSPKLRENASTPLLPSVSTPAVNWLDRMSDPFGGNALQRHGSLDRLPKRR